MSPLEVLSKQLEAVRMGDRIYWPSDYTDPWNDSNDNFYEDKTFIRLFFALAWERYDKTPRDIFQESIGLILDSVICGCPFCEMAKEIEEEYERTGKIAKQHM